MFDPKSIRQESQGDHAAVYDLIYRAFKQEDEAKLVNALREDAAFVPELSLVATDSDRIVGHILFTKINIKSDKTQCESLALAPVSVLPAHQGAGIGGALIRRGLEEALTLGFKSVILLGHAEYYPRFGFEPAQRWGIKAPFDVPPEVFMAIELEAGALENCSGTVQYSAPFGI